MQIIFLATILIGFIPTFASAQKLTLAHVAINPGQGLFWVVRDSCVLAKHGLSGDVVFIPAARTVQTLLAGEPTTRWWVRRLFSARVCKEPRE
jgi:hypothetical protein